MTIKRIYDGGMLLLSAYVVIWLAIDFAFYMPQNTRSILDVVDLLICVLFLIDWFFYFVRSKKKWSYFTTHLIEFISAIPFYSGFRILRVLRIFRIIRGYRSVKTVLGWYQDKPIKTGFYAYMSYLIMILLYSSAAFYKYELAINPKLNNYQDALWMSFTTITTIGYGDMYPATTLGRVIAAVLVLSGAGCLALLSGEVAAILLKKDRT